MAMCAVPITPGRKAHSPPPGGRDFHVQRPCESCERLVTEAQITSCGAAWCALRGTLTCRAA